MGRSPLINSGGASGENDFAEAAHGRHQQRRRRHGPDQRPQAFQRPMADGVKLLNLIQDVYLDESITIA